MNKKVLVSRMAAAAAAAACCAGAAQAQSSVEIYGLIDVGVTYYSKEATGTSTGSNVHVDSSFAQGSRLGFRGTEDLGGGLAAFYTLENGFNPDTGTAGQGGLLFGRQAFVGLKNRYAAVSLGRQDDFMADMAGYSAGALTPAGLIAWNLHSNAAAGYVLDDRVWADEVNNAIKVGFTGPAGLSGGVMYGAGERAGSRSEGAAWSLLGMLDQGSFSVGLAATRLNDVAPGASKTIWGLGARYAFTRLTTFGMVTQAWLSGPVAPKVTTYEAGVSYAITGTTRLGTAVEHQNRNHGVKGSETLLLTADYALSKRTDAYALLGYNRDRGYPAVVVAAVGNPSGTGSQTAFRLGLRHKF